MKRTFLIAFAALALASCGTTGSGGGLPSTPPAPATQTTADEKALLVAFAAYDAVLDVVQSKVADGTLKGAQAANVRQMLDRAWAALQAAKAARNAAGSASYTALYSNAVDAIASVRNALRGAVK